MKSPRNVIHPQVNRLLGSLSAEDFEDLLPMLEIEAMGLRESVYELNQPITHVYFPLNGILSILSVAGDAMIEVGEVGSEGMVGIPVFLGSATSPTLCFCQVPGYAARMEVEAFREEVSIRPDFNRLMQSYTLALFNQVSQLAACNRHHDMKQRLARWLLMTHDRAGTDQISLTQEFMAQMLGVRRATATAAAQSLQEAGLIRYRRGLLTILDRPGLAATACDCYRLMVDDFEKLIPNNVILRENGPVEWGIDEVEDSRRQ
jgi:CRP-like cAMP-binding protein